MTRSQKALLRLLRAELNRMIDEMFHPEGRWLEDFICHYIVEKATGLPDEVILLKALKYYGRLRKCGGRKLRRW